MLGELTSDPISILVGAPLGSPVSPVLSVIYTFPLLLKMRQWANTSLSMYVDNGLLFACGASYDAVNQRLRDAYSECDLWLTRSGLGIEPEKSELIYFARPRSTIERPTHIFLPLSSHSTYYKVDATNCVRYLGFHIDYKLQWQQHISILVNRVKSTLKSLQLLGNSVRGLDYTRWRLAYQFSCTVPNSGIRAR
jgi:Reverse transcriptase (RNA-dependent DNA polymerase)